MTKPFIGIALAGLGNVGQAVVTLLKERRSSLEASLGTQLRLLWIIDRHPDKKISRLKLPTSVLTSNNMKTALSDDRVDIVIELIGGEDAALNLAMGALRRSKHLITANKLLLAAHWEQLHSAGAAGGARLYYEAAVASAIPIIRTIREGLASSKITSLQGILNGTTNFILTRMIHDQSNYASALRQAQSRGIAEADPRLDVQGFDTAHKLSILASLITGVWTPPKLAYVEGIEGLETADILFAQQRLNCTCRLLGLLRQETGGHMDFRVHPALIDIKHPFATVHDEYNAIWLETDRAGDLYFQGRGAGAFPAANAVISDLVDAAKRVLEPRPAPPPKGVPRTPSIKPIEETACRYFVRVSAKDQPGILAKITRVMGDHQISIAQVYQGPLMGIPSRSGEAAVILVTHKTQERQMRQALRRLSGFGPKIRVASTLRFEGHVH